MDSAGSQGQTEHVATSEDATLSQEVVHEPVTVKEATRTPELASLYIRQTSNKDLKLSLLLRKCDEFKGQYKQAFLDAIFTAKTFEEWQGFALEQVVDPDDFIEMAKTALQSYRGRADESSVPDTSSAEFNKAVLMLVEECVKAMPEGNRKQITSLGYLIAQYKARHIYLKTAYLTDFVDALGERRLPGGFTWAALPESLQIKLLAAVHSE